MVKYLGSVEVDNRVRETQGSLGQASVGGDESNESFVNLSQTLHASVSRHGRTLRLQRRHNGAFLSLTPPTVLKDSAPFRAGQEMGST